MKNSIDYDISFIEFLALYRDHFWFCHRNEIIYRAIKDVFRGRPADILEIGAGSGNILSYLSGKGFRVDGSDIYEKSLDHIARDCSAVFRYDVNEDPDKCAGMERFRGKYDVVLLGDVIEHLKDPAQSLRNAKYFCKTDGIIIVTAPALQALWTEYDIISGHKRRYDARTLKEDFDRAGLRCLSMRYFFFAAAIGLFMSRKKMNVFRGSKEEFIKTKFRISAPANMFCKMICGAELLISGLVRLPFGSSIIGVGAVS